MFLSCLGFLLFSSGLSAAHSGWAVVLVPGVAAAGGCTPLLTSPLALLSRDGGCVCGSSHLLQAPFRRSRLIPAEGNASGWTESVAGAGPHPPASWAHAGGAEWGDPGLSAAGVNAFGASFSEVKRMASPAQGVGHCVGTKPSGCSHLGLSCSLCSSAVFLHRNPSVFKLGL